MSEPRIYNIRYPVEQRDYVEGRTEYPNGTVRTIEYVGNGLVRVTWDDSLFWDRH